MNERLKRIGARLQERLAGPPPSHDADPTRELERLLLGRIAAERIMSRDRVARLGDVGFRVSSQWGEDGIIEWLLQRIAVSAEVFVEFGVEDYTEANTRFLLQHRNWRGLVMDGNPEFAEHFQATDLCWRHDVTAASAFVTRDNIDGLLRAQLGTGPVGLLSIDIDGNDYWIWEAIESIVPDIVVCEYNALFGDLHAVTVPYSADFSRLSEHPSGLYCGASIRALEQLAEARGYCLIGSNLEGNNAFFVRDSLAGGLRDAVTDREALPSRFREARDASGALTYARGVARVEPILDLSVVDVSTGKERLLRSFGELYSPAWRAHMEG